MMSGIGGKLDVFPRVEFRSLFKQSHEEEFKLFLEPIDENLNGSSLEEVFPHAHHIESIEKWNPDLP